MYFMLKNKTTKHTTEKKKAIGTSFHRECDLCIFISFSNEITMEKYIYKKTTKKKTTTTQYTHYTYNKDCFSSVQLKTNMRDGGHRY